MIFEKICVFVFLLTTTDLVEGNRLRAINPNELRDYVFQPEARYPLQACEGDCDSDDDCAGDLKCFKRKSAPLVPGCSGTPRLNIDYCYDIVQFAAQIKNEYEESIGRELCTMKPLTDYGENPKSRYPLNLVCHIKLFSFIFDMLYKSKTFFCIFFLMIVRGGL